MTKRPNVMDLDALMRPETPEPAPVAPIPEPVTPEPVPAETVAEEPAKGGKKATPDVFRTSLYFHRTVHDALREVAFGERVTVSDLINEGIDMVLKARGLPSAADLKAKGMPGRKRVGVL